MTSQQVTDALSRITAGDRQAAAELLPLVYAELRKLARARIASERSDISLGATALVHEAYLRLVGTEQNSWANRSHFFAAAAEAMRRVLIDRARRRDRAKHGGGQRRVTLDEDRSGDDLTPEQLLPLDRALTRLEARDEQMALVVKLRFFVGLSVAETADLLAISERSVNRQWTAARAWLYNELGDAHEG